MNIEQLISPQVPTLSPNDSIRKARTLMERNKMTQLPVLSNAKYMALLLKNDVVDYPVPESPLSKADFLQYRPAVPSSGHPWEALRILNQQNLSIVPVVDQDNTYLGAITRSNLLDYIAAHSGVESPGGILTLELNPHDYSLAEIARICESDDVIIISSQLATVPETGRLQLTLKVNKTDLHGLVVSLERHDFTVLHVFGVQNFYDDVLDRYKLLMNYINM